MYFAASLPLIFLGIQAYKKKINSFFKFYVKKNIFFVIFYGKTQRPDLFPHSL